MPRQSLCQSTSNWAEWMLSTCLAERHVKLLQYGRVHLSDGVVFALNVLLINLYSQVPNIRHSITSEQPSSSCVACTTRAA